MLYRNVTDHIIASWTSNIDGGMTKWCNI